MTHGTEREDILTRVDAAMRSSVTGRADLYEMSDFPDDVWRALAAGGLMGLSLPGSVGGLDGGYAALAEAAHRMSEVGGVMGVTTTWLAHNLNASLHLSRRGTAKQRADWLPGLARGDMSVAMAISEPGAGAHPKYLKTQARRDGAYYVIDGEKSYLTNGPLAGVFIVLAITGQAQGRNTFTALLVPRDTPGLSLTPGVKIDFLHPSPHCGIELKGCRVPVENTLGQTDSGFSEISLPMRAIEDALATSSKAGALHALLRFVARSAGDLDEKERLAEFGLLLAKADALSTIARKLAAELDSDDAAPERLNSASAGFRAFAGALQRDIDAFVTTNSIVLSLQGAQLQRDLAKSFSIARSAHQLQAAKRAASYLHNEEAT